MTSFLCWRRRGFRHKITMVTSFICIFITVTTLRHTPPPEWIPRNVTAPVSSPMGEYCLQRPLASDKSFKVSFQLHTFEELNELHGSDLQKGGHHSPVLCKPDQKVAIVIPYRDRENHLKMWLNNMHPYLKKQSVDYTIFVIEQLPGSNFNRGILKNIGFVEAQKIREFDCFFFHDIDMVPDDYANMYRCGNHPRHHAKNLARWNHIPQRPTFYGGVVSMKAEHFRKANGYPNIYFEWGAEDDELGKRLTYRNMEIIDYPFEVTTYEEFDHEHSEQYINTHLYKRWASRIEKDGVNTVKEYYRVIKVDLQPLYTLISVSINKTAVRIANNGDILEPWGGSIPKYFLDRYALYFL